jgi:hypothetical protein
LQRFGDQIAILVASGNFDRRDRRQLALFAEVLLVAAQRAVGCHFRQQALQRDACAARNAERARDLSLSGLTLRGIQEFEDLFFAGQAAIGGRTRAALLACRRRAS